MARWSLEGGDLPGTWFPDPPAPRRRAPPRGVDVKQPPSGRPGRRPGPLASQGGLWGPFRALEGSPGGPREGSLEPQTSKTSILGVCQIPTPSARGVLHQPLAPGPCPRFSRNPRNCPKMPKMAKTAVFRVFGGDTPFWAFFGQIGAFSPISGILGKPGTGPRREGLM